ncbi:MAG: penicillin-binding protein activator [Alphaproteobacteria bacterium]
MALLSEVRQIILSARFGISSVCAAVLLTACATAPGPYNPGPVVQGPQQPQQPGPIQPQVPDTQPLPDIEIEPDPPKIMRDGLTPPHMRGRDIKRLALLLPFSSKSDRLREEAGSMLKAAEMAVFARGEADILLIALDTAGTPEGATSATRAAVKSGADVILGPVLASSVVAASAEARRTATPVIAFSTDQSVAGNGTYLVSFPPESEVKRIVEYAGSTGVRNFAFLGPQSTYGQRVLGAYRRTVSAVGGQVTATETYDGNDISVMQAPAKKIADFYKSREARAQAQAQDQGRRPIEAILLPEAGTALRSLAPLLPYYDVDPAHVQFLGTGLWHNEDIVREPALNGGVFAGPPEDARRAFLESYDARYGEEASRLSSLAYDAVGVGSVVATGNPAGRHARAQDPAGFYGADGLLRFNRNGTPDRGLAIFQIQNGRFVVIEPAPRQALGPS